MRRKLAELAVRATPFVRDMGLGNVQAGQLLDDLDAVLGQNARLEKPKKAKVAA